MKQYLVLFLILFFTNCVYKNSKVIDSPVRIKSPLVIKYDSIIKYYGGRKEYDSAKFYTKKLLIISQRNKDSIEIAKSNYRLGYYNKRNGFYELSF